MTCPMQPEGHLYTSHVLVTGPTGGVVLDTDVCSWCLSPKTEAAPASDAGAAVRVPEDVVSL